MFAAAGTERVVICAPVTESNSRTAIASAKTVEKIIVHS